MCFSYRSNRKLEIQNFIRLIKIQKKNELMGSSSLIQTLSSLYFSETQIFRQNNQNMIVFKIFYHFYQTVTFYFASKLSSPSWILPVKVFSLNYRRFITTRDALWNFFYPFKIIYERRTDKNENENCKCRLFLAYNFLNIHSFDRIDDFWHCRRLLFHIETFEESLILNCENTSDWPEIRANWTQKSKINWITEDSFDHTNFVTKNVKIPCILTVNQQKRQFLRWNAFFVHEIAQRNTRAM